MNSIYDLGDKMIANEDQKLAIDKMISFLKSDNEEFTLIGKGGTGKTTIIKQIVKYFNTLNKGSSFFSNYVIAATVSHAAKNVLRKSLGATSIITVTVAKLLGMRANIDEEGNLEFIPDPKSWKVAPPPIKQATLLIIDECSMISSYLLSLIREHKKEGTKIIFMGDIRQLPPIDKQREQDEDSETFKIINNAILFKRMRQSETNPIVGLSDIFADNIDKYIETGSFNRKPLTKELRIDSYNKETNEGILFPKTINETFQKLLIDFKYAFEHQETNYVKVIAYRNKNPHGVAPYNINAINNTIRKKLWNTKEQYVIGEILIANNHYTINREVVIQNGDSMIIQEIFKQKIEGIECCILNLRKEDKSIIYNIPVIAKEGQQAFFTKKKKLAFTAKKNHSIWKKYYNFLEYFASLSYGYAVTSHKAQGSGYNNIYIFEDDIMGVNMITYKEKNQCMYTAITRAKEKCVIFSEENK